MLSSINICLKYLHKKQKNAITLPWNHLTNLIRSSFLFSFSFTIILREVTDRPGGLTDGRINRDPGGDQEGIQLGPPPRVPPRPNKHIRLATGTSSGVEETLPGQRKAACRLLAGSLHLSRERFSVTGLPANAVQQTGCADEEPTVSDGD